MKELILTTDRLFLKLVTQKDLEKIHALHALAETDQYNTLGIPENIQETQKIVTDCILENNKEAIQRFTFAVTLKNDDTFIGMIGINLGKPKYRNAEVWFKFDVHFWNKGYATETL